MRQALHLLKKNSLKKSRIHEKQATLQQQDGKKFYILYAVFSIIGTVVTILRAKYTLFAGSDVLGELFTSGAAVIPIIAQHSGSVTQVKQHNGLAQQFLELHHEINTALYSTDISDECLIILESKYQSLVGRSLFSPVFPEAVRAGNAYMQDNDTFTRLIGLRSRRGPCSSIAEEALKRHWAHEDASLKLFKTWRRMQVCYMVAAVVMVTFPILRVNWEDSAAIFAINAVVIASGIGTQIVHLSSDSQTEAIEHAKISHEFFNLFESAEEGTTFLMERFQKNLHSLMTVEDNGLIIANLGEIWDVALDERGIGARTESPARSSSPSRSPSSDIEGRMNMGQNVFLQVKL